MISIDKLFSKLILCVVCLTLGAKHTTHIKAKIINK